jgi:NADP-dependent 3-hydroxy acid dehydrogenase YdfG
LKENLREKRIGADLQEVLSSEAGRRVIGGIFHDCGFWKAIFCGEAVQATAFQEGLRAAAVGLANRIREIDPTLIARCEIDWRNFEADARAANEKAKEDGE